ncbi:MAG TPA: UPF0280 family protein [Anaerovoracaceae bacterium]|nr:UPF0280 family protein [Anaerovoracaceae bacterium]
MYEERFYREKHKSNDLINYQLLIEESDLMISSDIDVKTQAEEALFDIRNRIKKACSEIEGFKTSLIPINHTSNDPMINQMIKASEKANVGPMAAVAGTVSEYVVKNVLNNSNCSQIIVENGGDIYINSNVARKILIYAGDSPFSNKIGLKIDKDLMPIGVCTSAGKVGHSLSFGQSDAALVISKNTSLADATATAIGNLVKEADDINKALEFGKNIDGILGILVILEDKLGIWGQIELFKAE